MFSSIGRSAFSNCSSLQSICVPESLADFSDLGKGAKAVTLSSNLNPIFTPFTLRNRQMGSSGRISEALLTKGTDMMSGIEQ
jgi:hypothetical protein